MFELTLALLGTRAGKSPREPHLRRPVRHRHEAMQLRLKTCMQERNVLPIVRAPGRHQNKSWSGAVPPTSLPQTDSPPPLRATELLPQQRGSVRTLRPAPLFLLRLSRARHRRRHRCRSRFRCHLSTAIHRLLRHLCCRPRTRYRCHRQSQRLCPLIR